jgi:hypothetical protein
MHVHLHVESGKSPDAQLDVRPRERVSTMTDPELSILRERAERGDSDAIDQLVELAGERGDMDELRRFADRGNSTAADELVQLATELEDLDELRRLADNGNSDAADQLAELTDE